MYIASIKKNTIFRLVDIGPKAGGYEREAVLHRGRGHHRPRGHPGRLNHQWNWFLYLIGIEYFLDIGYIGTSLRRAQPISIGPLAAIITTTTTYIDRISPYWAS